MTTIPPTPINHEAIAEAIMLQAREIAQSINGFGYAATGRRRKISSTANLPDEFLEAVAVACDASPQLAAASELTGAELRSLITSSRAYTSAANELRLIGRGLDDTVAEHRSEVGQKALRAYAIAKSINRPDERELLIPHLENMKLTLNRGPRPSKKKTAPPPAPVPAPPPAPPTPTPTPTTPPTAPPVSVPPRNS